MFHELRHWKLRWRISFDSSYQAENIHIYFYLSCDVAKFKKKIIVNQKIYFNSKRYSLTAQKMIYIYILLNKIFFFSNF